MIKKHEDAGTKYLNNSNAFIWVFEYNGWQTDKPDKEKMLIVFDDMIADIMRNLKFQAIIKELFIRCRKLNISLVLIT